MKELSINEAHAADYYMASLILFAVSRFIFTGLMKFFKPGSLLAFSAFMAIISTLFVIVGNGYTSVIALVAISAFMSLMFPTIFGLAVKDLGTDTKIGGSGLIMAILGGAVMTMIQGRISDYTGNIATSFIVPLICFLFIFYYGFQESKKKPGN
jgi:FHS family L-fucose permease-like MFS transporter